MFQAFHSWSNVSCGLFSLLPSLDSVNSQLQPLIPLHYDGQTTTNLSVLIRQSKTDPFRTDHVLHITATGISICLVKAMLLWDASWPWLLRTCIFCWPVPTTNMHTCDQHHPPLTAASWCALNILLKSQFSNRGSYHSSSGEFPSLADQVPRSVEQRCIRDIHSLPARGHTRLPIQIGKGECHSLTVMDSRWTLTV